MAMRLFDQIVSQEAFHEVSKRTTVSLKYSAVSNVHKVSLTSQLKLKSPIPVLPLNFKLSFPD